MKHNSAYDKKIVSIVCLCSCACKKPCEFFSVDAINEKIVKAVCLRESRHRKSFVLITLDIWSLGACTTRRVVPKRYFKHEFVMI